MVERSPYRIQMEDAIGGVHAFVGKRYPEITAGNPRYAKVVLATGGGRGLIIKKTRVRCADPYSCYTLELAHRREKCALSGFTGSAFSKGQPGDATKMAQTNTPFRQAGSVMECRRTRMMVIHEDDITFEDSRGYQVRTQTSPGGIHAYGFGEVIRVWARQP